MKVHFLRVSAVPRTNFLVFPSRYGRPMCFSFVPESGRANEGSIAILAKEIPQTALPEFVAPGPHGPIGQGNLLFDARL